MLYKWCTSGVRVQFPADRDSDPTTSCYPLPCVQLLASSRRASSELIPRWADAPGDEIVVKRDEVTPLFPSATLISPESKKIVATLRQPVVTSEVKFRL